VDIFLKFKPTGVLISEIGSFGGLTHD